jgi:integrase
MPIPRVTIYIRKQQPKRHYERVKTYNPQPCGEGDVYCLHIWHNGKRQWKVVGTDLNEALAAQLKTYTDLALKAKAGAAPKLTPTANKTLVEFKEQFLQFKRTTRKRDGTPLDAETIAAYEQQVNELLSVARVQCPEEITGQDLRDYMEALRKRGLSHRSVCNNYTSIATFLKFAGIDHKTLLSYNERPTPDDETPEPYTEKELKAFFNALTDERHRLFFEVLLKVGPREREATTLEWPDLDLGKEPCVTIQARKPHLKQRVKTGRGRVVPLERNLALKLAAWRAADPTTKLVFGTSSDKEDTHFFRTAIEAFKRAGLPIPRRPLHRFRDTAACNWLRSGVDLRTVSAWLGHSSVTQTEKYLSPVKGEQAQQLINRVYPVDLTERELTAAVQ